MVTSADVATFADMATLAVVAALAVLVRIIVPLIVCVTAACCGAVSDAGLGTDPIRGCLTARPSDHDEASIDRAALIVSAGMTLTFDALWSL